jgi:hypothetical protein
MRRLLPVLSLVALLLVLTPALAYAQPLAQGGPEEKGIDIGTVIGTLGLYAAMMAVLAVGTEVMIDTVRPIFGLQRKTSTEEALAKLKEWLPGTVKDLGLSDEATKSLDKVVGNLEQYTKAFGDKAEQARAIVQDQWPSILKDLGVQAAEKVLEDYWGKIEPQLQALLGSGTDTAQVRTWLTNALNQFRATGMTDVQNQLSLIGGMLEEVEQQRHKIQSPLRRFWRWLRDGLVGIGEGIGTKYQLDKQDVKVKGKWFWRILRGLFFLPAYVEYGWARIRGNLDGGVRWIEGIKQLGKVKPFDPLRSIQEAAQRILEENTRQALEEETRVKWLRIVSVVVGIVLAAALQVDSFLLLRPVLGESVTNVLARPAQEAAEPQMKTMADLLVIAPLPIRTPESKAEAMEVSAPVPLSPWERVCNGASWVVNWMLRLTPGFILSGLGAAAGSGFWHDQLDKLRSAKEVASQLEKLTGQGEK